MTHGAVPRLNNKIFGLICFATMQSLNVQHFMLAHAWNQSSFIDILVFYPVPNTWGVWNNPCGVFTQGSADFSPRGLLIFHLGVCWFSRDSPCMEYNTWGISRVCDFTYLRYRQICYKNREMRHPGYNPGYLGQKLLKIWTWGSVSGQSSPSFKNLACQKYW